MKITLQVDGREIILSENDMIKITLHVDRREVILSENDIVGLVRANYSKKNAKSVKTLTEGRRFEVNPKTINRKFFKKERKDLRQEETRELILEAFAKVDANPKKYGRIFETVDLKKIWESKTWKELKDLVREVADHEADWVEQCLIWGQVISNEKGKDKAWQTICNNPDTKDLFNIITWKDGYGRIVGGSVRFEIDYPASYVNSNEYHDDSISSYSMPLGVCYK